MQLVFDRTDLLDPVHSLQGVTSGRNTLPILSNIKIKTKDDMVELSGTNLEIGITIHAPAAIEEQGEITVSSSKLFEVVSALPSDQEITMTTKGKVIELTCGAGIYKIHGLATDDFPEIPTLHDSNFTVDATEFLSTIHKTVFAASEEETRYFLNGVCLNFKENKTEIAATDGRRLAVTEINKPMPTDQTKIIIPIKSIREIVKAFEESVELNISLHEGQLILTNGETTLATRLIDGEYPSYESIIPQGYTNEVLVKRRTLYDAVKRVSILSNPKTYSITLEINDMESIEVYAKAAELGEAHETVDPISGRGEIKFAVDARFLMDTLQHIETDEVVIQYEHPTKAIILTPSAAQDYHLCLIMPMRIEE